MDFIFLTYQEICVELGQRLRKRRITLNLTQPELAIRAGLSKATISKIENQGQATLESFIRVAQALDLVRELQPLFTTEPTSIAQLVKMAEPARKRVSRKRAR